MSRASHQEIQIKQELSKFINLLQHDYNSADDKPNSLNTDHLFHKKLSIILSASEPESSSLDKDTAQISSNHSFDSTSTEPQNIFNQLLQSPLNESQRKLINQLKHSFEKMVEQSLNRKKICEMLKKQLNQQKEANDQMLTALMDLQKQEKQLWNNYNLMADKYNQSKQKNQYIQEQIKQLTESVRALQNDNDFMKKLIFHANQNYEALQKSCNQLKVLRDIDNTNTDHRKAKQSSYDNLLKSAKTKKQGYSPTRSDFQHSPGYQDFQQVYRKMIVRTLKFKGKPQQVR